MQMPDSQIDKEVMIQQLVEQGETQEAVTLLTQMAVDAANNHNFNKADELRNRLYEVDSMALSAIVSVNEAIETAKSKFLEDNRGGLWQRFIKELPKEEGNAFLFALTEAELPADHLVLTQGKANDRLNFVSQGQLKVFYESETKQVMIRQLGPGHVLGEDTFFSVNVCTLSSATLTRVRLSYLTRERYDILTKQFPLFPEHLQKICLSGKKTYDLLRQKGIDRRQYKRVNYQTKLWFQVLSSGSHQALMKPMAGELWDISKTGLSYYFQHKNPTTVRNLLGKTLGLRFNLAVKGHLKEVSLTGVVQGVQNHPLDEYSVHVQLSHKFSDEAMNTIRRIAERK